MKKLISVRLDENILEYLDSVCSDWNKESLYLETPSRKYYRSDIGYLSRADVIEMALEYYFENCCEKK